MSKPANCIKCGSGNIDEVYEKRHTSGSEVTHVRSIHCIDCNRKESVMYSEEVANSCNINLIDQVLSELKYQWEYSE